jgi:hypothetical protein
MVVESCFICIKLFELHMEADWQVRPGAKHDDTKRMTAYGVVTRRRHWNGNDSQVRSALGTLKRTSRMQIFSISLIVGNQRWYNC